MPQPEPTPSAATEQDQLNRLTVILGAVRLLTHNREAALAAIASMYESPAVSKSDIRVLQVVEDVVRRS